MFKIQTLFKKIIRYVVLFEVAKTLKLSLKFILR